MTTSKPALSIQSLQAEASLFAKKESTHWEPSMFGVTDGKAVGTYLEHKFQDFIGAKYEYERGSSAEGIDLPGLGVDIKTTSIKQPQSSCPYKSARQKIYGLGYNLLVFVYDKNDDPKRKSSQLNIVHAIFVERENTADFQTTSAILKLLENHANRDDIMALFEERNLPVDEIQAQALADEILKSPPRLGYLTISNALQWRLQYKRIIDFAGQVEGIRRL